MIIHGCEQMTLEWIRLHFGIPTAACLDQLLTPEFELRKGEMPKTLIYKKVAEKIQNRPLIDLSQSSFMMEQGMIIEEEARPWFELEYEKKVTRVGFITTDDGRVGCSPDGLILGDAGIDGCMIDPRNCGIEIKCPAAHTHVKYLVNGVLPKEYVAQVYGSMFVTGFKKWIFVSYRRGFPSLVLEIPTQQAIMDKIASAVDSFHREFDLSLIRIMKMKMLRDLEAA